MAILFTALAVTSVAIISSTYQISVSLALQEGLSTFLFKKHLSMNLVSFQTTRKIKAVEPILSPFYEKLFEILAQPPSPKCQKTPAKCKLIKLLILYRDNFLHKNKLSQMQLDYTCYHTFKVVTSSNINYSFHIMNISIHNCSPTCQMVVFRIASHNTTLDFSFGF